MADEIESLNEEIIKCESCPLCKNRTKAVVGSGSHQSKIFFVGEAPGANEDLKGVPFVGRAGDVLTNLLKESGFNKDDIYISNAVKCRPPQNRKPSKQELATCSKFLDTEIKILKPDWIIALGESAMLRMVGYANIAGRHGNVTFSEKYKCKIFLSYHPALVLYKPKMKEVMLQDFKKLYKEIFEKKEESEKGVEVDERFVNLHVHDHYSFLDGLGKTDQYVERAKSLGQIALAQTNHRNISGSLQFIRSCNKSKIKPIVGCEFDVVENMTIKGIKVDGAKKTTQQPRHHLTALARNKIGYKNLIKLVSLSNTIGYYYRPRIDWKTISENREGIIFMSACLRGRVASAIITKDEDPVDALRHMKKYLGKFALEIMPNDMEEQKLVNNALVKLSERYDIPLVATVDAHFLLKKDSKTHNILLQIQTKNSNFKFASEYFWLMSADEIFEAFKNNHPSIPSETIKKAMMNTVKIAKMIEPIELDLKPVREAIPKYPLPKGQVIDEFFKNLLREGWKRRKLHKFDDKQREVYKDRLKDEMSQLTSYGLLNYFLVVWDMINWCKDNGILVGPGRGSSAGSLVSYLLGITNIDPIRFGLLFSRFISPERYSGQYDFSFKDFPVEDWKKKVGLV